MKKVLAILSLIILASCGARKVNKSSEDVKEKKEIVSVDTTKTKTNETIKTIKTNDSVISCIEVSPIDTSKAFTYNGTTIKNGVLRLQKTRVNKTYQTEKNLSKTKDKGVSKDIKTQKRVQVEVKQVDKKESYLDFLWWILLVVIGYILYRRYIK